MFPTRLTENFSKFRAVVLEWLDYYFKCPKPIVCIYGLIVVHAWIENALVAILITHLTDDLLHLPKAASMVNVQDGMTAFLVLLVAYASDAHLGPFKAVVSTTIGYAFGLLLLFLAAGCVEGTEIYLLYMAVMLIALGRAGRDVSLKEFLTDQFRVEGSSEDEDEAERRAESRRKVWWRSARFLGIGASPYLLTNSEWARQCKISAIAMAAAFGLFIGGSAFYKRKKPTKSVSLSNVLRLNKAAIRNRHLSHTFDKDHILYVRGLRWLDKAAIKESSPPVEEQTRKEIFFSVDEVREVKTLLTMIPLWTTFLVYGLLQATGNTFFYEQVSYMDNHLGKISNVPVVIFVIIRTSTGFIVSRLCDLLFTTYWSDKIPRFVNLVRIGGGMAISPVCCIVAWRVENYRRHKYVNHEISISFLWLVPQFVLVGAIDGLVYDGMEEIFCTVVPKSLRNYGPSCTQFALEIGNFISLASILLFHGLFDDDLDESRLDVYYAWLGLICFVNFVFHCYVATHYVKKKSSDDQGIEQVEQQLQSFEDNRPEENQPHVG